MADTHQINGDAPSAGSPKSRRMLTVVIAAALVLGEGLGIFIITRMLYYQPKAAAAGELTPEQQALRAAEDQVELALPEIDAFNKREGRLYLYNIEVTLLVPKNRAEEIQKILDMRKSTIMDRFNTVIRGADNKYLNEPGLDTLRRQFQFELNKILGDDHIVQDLLIPRFYQSPADL